MDDKPTNILARLKQHHLYGVVVIYAVVVGFLMQLASRAFPYFGWDGAVPVVIIVLLLGFPVVVVLAWLLIEPKDPAKSDTWQRRHWKLSALVTAVVIVLVAVSGFYALHFPLKHTLQLRSAAPATSHASAAIPAKSVAVLPFENLSDDKKNEYFVAGMQALILTKLADVGDLKVISRTSTAQYKSHPENLKRIGEQLGVATILEGSVQKTGDQVLINVQLIDAQTDSHIWAQSYQRTLDNVFGVEGEMAGQIATALQAKLSPAESAGLAAVPTTNQAAMDWFLRAEFQLNKGFTNYDTANFRAAIPLYRQAIEQDPHFALAYAQMSRAEGALVWFGGAAGEGKQLRDQARADAEQALKLAPNTAAAHIALGYSDYWGRSDYPGALTAFATALKFKPNDTEAFAAQGYVERRQGHFDAAIASLQQAFTLDPRNSQMALELGGTFLMAGRYSEAQEWLQRALLINPDNLNAKKQYSNAILYATGDVAVALQAVSGDATAMKLARVGLLVYQRNYHAALALLDSVPDTPDNFPGGSVGSYKALQQAELYWLLGDTAKARPLFQQVRTVAHKKLARQQRIGQAFTRLDLAETEFGLENTSDGLKMITEAMAIADRSDDFINRASATQRAAVLYAMARRPDLAFPRLAEALAMTGIGYNYSPTLLWLDPAWDPIRKDARFQVLLQQYAQYKPAVIPAASTAAL